MLKLSVKVGSVSIRAPKKAAHIGNINGWITAKSGKKCMNIVTAANTETKKDKVPS